MTHVRRFGFSGALAVSIVVVMLFGINPITVLTGQVAKPLPHTPLTALAAIEAGDGQPADLVSALERETDGFWARGFRNGAAFYPAAELVMVPTRTDLGCGMSGSSIGTFYCPENSTIYVDMAAYADLVTAYPDAGHQAEAYLIGLAYGHHVQNAQKMFEERQQQSASMDQSVLDEFDERLSAQAACYAGASTKWAGLPALLDKPAIAEAIGAALAGGRDVTRATSRAADPLPHDLAPASAELTRQWFDIGYAIPAIGSCRLDKIELSS
ncbi:MAG: neutral zinc metallopeptidase [Alphaproteobacteria bacterium]|nr:neutral zinc metallopeptidase [Alphaproteobacteria bacterium]